MPDRARVERPTARGAIWQKLGKNAQAVRHVSIATDNATRFEQITMAFDNPSLDALASALEWSRNQAWVINAAVGGHQG